MAFCNNAGPLFVIGTVGTAFFSDITAGMILFAVHGAAAVICAAIFHYGGKSGYKTTLSEDWEYYKKNKPHIGRLVSECGISCAGAMGTVCVFVITFSAIINLLPVDNHPVAAGIIEVTCGLRELSRRGFAALPAASALLAWGGLSVHFQAAALCGGVFSMKKYYTGRVTAAFISYALTYLACNDIHLLLPVSVFVIGAMLLRIYREQLRPCVFRQRRRS